MWLESLVDGLNEYLTIVDSGQLTAVLTNNGHNITLEGPAPINDFKQVITTLRYTNTAEERLGILSSV